MNSTLCTIHNSSAFLFARNGMPGSSIYHYWKQYALLPGTARHMHHSLHWEHYAVHSPPLNWNNSPCRALLWNSTLSPYIPLNRRSTSNMACCPAVPHVPECTRFLSWEQLPMYSSISNGISIHNTAFLSAKEVHRMQLLFPLFYQLCVIYSNLLPSRNRTHFTASHYWEQYAINNTLLYTACLYTGNSKL